MSSHRNICWSLGYDVLQIEKRRGHHDAGPAVAMRRQRSQIRINSLRRNIHLPIGDCVAPQHTAAVYTPIIDAMATPESEAIPYEPLDLQGERLLVLAPHPDDEVIGCGGLIARHLLAGRRVRVVVVTDGAEAGAPKVREEESRLALALL